MHVKFIEYVELFKLQDVAKTCRMLLEIKFFVKIMLNKPDCDDVTIV